MSASKRLYTRSMPGYEVVLVSSRLSIGLVTVNTVFSGYRRQDYVMTMKVGLLCVLSNLACTQILT